ncbi:alanine racemase [Deinococcus aquaedulcis]|uniref:alanine racemase n=1 Tax=Deinococcus aquaedulcis TaxID=2840455 RepID=UPI001C83A326|nr:alanine racemase [Deinococcus aquaedulcis]
MTPLRFRDPAEPPHWTAPSPATRLQAYRTAFAGRAGPFAYVDLDAFDANARALRARAAGQRVRIATKSLRCTDLLRRVLASDPQYAGLMCYDPREAAFLAREGFDDLLLAYPTTDAPALRDLAGAAVAGTRVCVMVDSEAHLPPLEAAARAAQTTLNVCLDLDLSQTYPGLRFGVYRSPLRTVHDVVRLAGRVADSPHLRLSGLMGYEAQVAGVGDAAPGMRGAAVRALRRRAVPDIARRRAEAVQALRAVGHRLDFVNGGGTGSLETTAAEDVVTEVTVGSGLYAPALFDHYRAFRHAPAAGFALTVTRLPVPGVATCQGGGYVASGASGPDRLPQPALPLGLRLLPLEGAGEVQTPLRVPPGVTLRVGDLVFFRHAKAGELCAHFPALHAVQGGREVGVLPTYRGQGQAFG